MTKLTTSQMKDDIMLKKKPVQSLSVKEFFIAVRSRDHKKVKRMLKDRVVAPDARDTEDPLRPTALHVACEIDDEETAWMLLKLKNNPADVNSENSKGRRPIWWAAMHGSVSLAEVLLRKPGCEVNEVDRETGCTPLYRAILSNSEPVCRMLIHAGADVNMRRLGMDGGAETPLIKAVQLNNLSICECLINSLCNLQAKTDNGFTALHFAVTYRRYDICRLLLNSRSKVHCKSNTGVTPMTVAIENHNPAMVKIFLQYGYKMDKKYKWKETPLEQAIKLHSEVCAITLIHWGCSVETLKGKPSYFYMAVNEQLMSVIKFLLDVQPSFLNERWVRNRKWPVAIYRRQDVCDWLIKESKTVRSLKSLCRGKIFRHLGMQVSSKIDRLPLPEGLKEYLKFNHHIKDSFYREVPLDIHECPYDCLSMCPLKYCPPLDISSSDSDDLDF